MLDINNLKHAATNVFGTRLEGYIDFDQENEVYYLYEKNGKKLGYIDFTILDEKKLIFINDMESYVRNNNNNYKGIGSLLHEFVFYYVAQNKINYPIQLTTAYGSPVFHFKCGYRFLDEKQNEKMCVLIKNGFDISKKKEDTKDFPDSMMMPLDVLEQKKQNYYPQPSSFYITGPQ